jgi:hypothetical protein
VVGAMAACAVLEKEAVTVDGRVALSTVVSAGDVADNGPRLDQDNVISPPPLLAEHELERANGAGSKQRPLCRAKTVRCCNEVDSHHKKVRASLLNKDWGGNWNRRSKHDPWRSWLSTKQALSGRAEERSPGRQSMRRCCCGDDGMQGGLHVPSVFCLNDNCQRALMQPRGCQGLQVPNLSWNVSFQFVVSKRKQGQPCHLSNFR